MSPEEFASKIDESTEYQRLQVVLLQRIAGYAHVILWAVALCAIFLLSILLQHTGP